MTKLIAALIIIVVLIGGYNLFVYWEKVKNEEESVRKTEAAKEITSDDQLQGLPEKLAPSLDAAKKQGVAGMRNWLKTYGSAVQDPRKAWLELDFVVAVTREDPAEAKRVFASVKERVPHSSPVWPRIEKLRKTYE